MQLDEREPHPAYRPAHVLVVEDHAATAEMLRMILEDEGYEVTCVGTGSAALGVFSSYPLAHAEHPQLDLLLLDLTLPDMDAVDMVERLHEEDGPREVPPVVLLSAKQYNVMQVAADSIGAAAIVRKPFALETLLDSIKVALAKG